MYLNAANFGSPMTGMNFLSPSTSSPMSGGSPMLAMQQFYALMMGLISSLFQSSFGGGAMTNVGGVPLLSNFGGGGTSSGGIGGGGGINGFLGGPSGTKDGTGKFGSTPAQPGGKSSFNVASFNVLGSSHTAPGGNKPGRPSGVSRMRGAVAAMKSHNIDIAGMQEFQGDQKKAFQRLAPDFGVVGSNDNAIVYNKKKFRLVEKRSFKIPYFEGKMKEMPIAKLEDKSTGKQVWVVNIHNPADTKAHPHNAKNRARAINIEQNLMRQLQATGIPVIFTGDFNDGKSVDGSMDRVGMNSAAPNKARRSIDYIFGSSGVNFSNYSNDQRTKANGTSDHPIIVSTATI